MARGLLGRKSRLHIRQQRGVALREADVVLMIGMVADFRLDYGRTFNKKSKVRTRARACNLFVFCVVRCLRLMY